MVVEGEAARLEEEDNRAAEKAHPAGVAEDAAATALVESLRALLAVQGTVKRKTNPPNFRFPRGALYVLPLTKKEWITSRLWITPLNGR